MIITRKIELVVIADTAETKTAQWSWLRNLSKDVFKAYNLVMSNQYFNELFTERIMKTDPELAEKKAELDEKILKATDAIKAEKDKDAKEKLVVVRNKIYKQVNMLAKAAREKAVELYLTSEQNSTYQLLGSAFPEMPSGIRSVLNMDACQQFKNAIFDVKNGKQTLPTFRDGVPVPFDKNSMRFKEALNEKGEPEIFMNWLNGIKFLMRFGEDRSDNRIIVQRMMSGTYQYSNSKIKIDGKKIFMLLCVDIPDETFALNKNLVVGVNLGISVPAYCALSKGKARLAIGDINDFFRVRRQMQERRRRIQKQLKQAKGGKGRDKKLKGLERVSDCERNFTRTYNHTIARNIVNFALKHGAGTIAMELLEGYGEEVPDSIILRNWSYFELHQLVEYKAQRVGIEVKYNDPYRISQTCNACGEYHEDNLENRNNFVCKNEKCSNFGVKVFSDYNAALNNANRFRLVSKKEDCQFYKLRQEEKEAA